MTSHVLEYPTPSVSRSVAAEVRAEMGRLGINQSTLAARMHVAQPWLSRRISPTSTIALTLEEVFAMAEALGVPAQRLLASLPRLDSNQQPSGYPSAQVVDLDRFRCDRTRLAS